MSCDQNQLPQLLEANEDFRSPSYSVITASEALSEKPTPGMAASDTLLLAPGC